MPGPADHVDEGSIIGETYEVMHHLGEGGMGTVWAARHLRLPAKEVAVKVLRIDMRLPPDAYARFRHEAQIIARIEHPNIVQVLDFNALPGGTPYMVLELLRGETLRERLTRGRLQLDQAMTVAAQIGLALGAAHDQGVVHRDLKPSNVFLCQAAGGAECAHVKVLDFGISKIQTAETVTTVADAFIGTPRYMAPEQIRGTPDHLGPSTDVFAFAAVLYEMLAGQPAFTAQGVVGIAMQILNGTPAPVRDLNPDVPDTVIAALERALEKDPAQRFASVADFVTALNRPVVRSTRSSITAPSAKTTGRNLLSRTQRTLVAGALVLLLFGVALYAWRAGLLEQFAATLPQTNSSLPAVAANTVAVWEFDNQRADDSHNDWYRKALQASFNTELNKIPQISVVAPEVIQRAANEVGLDRIEAARSMGVGRFISGSFVVSGSVIRIDAHVVDTSNGLQQLAEKIEGDPGEFFALQRELTLAVLGHFVSLTKAQEANLTSKTNASVEKYHMLLEAEGVTKPSGPSAIGPQSSHRTLDARPERWWAALAIVRPAFAESRQTAEAAARQLLEDYRLAHEAGDLQRLAALHVAFPDNQRQAVEKYVRNISNLRVELDDVRIEPQGNDVMVSYTRRDRFVDKETGEAMTLEVHLTRYIVQDGGQWKFAPDE